MYDEGRGSSGLRHSDGVINMLIEEMREKPGGAESGAKGKKRRWIIVVSVLVLMGVAVTLYVRQRREKAGLEYAVEQLNAAVASGDLAALSRWVDFDELTGSLADIWNRVRSETPPTGAGRRALQHKMQAALHEAFSEPPRATPEQEEKNEGKAGSGPKVEEEKKGFTTIPSPVPVLPEDFAAQLAAEPFRVRGRDGDHGLAATQIRHPGLGLQLPLQLAALRTSSGWRFTRLANADHVVRIWKKANEDFHIRREALFAARNAEIREIMNRHCCITECRAGVAKVEKDGSVLITVDLEGTNTGNEVLRSAGLYCRLEDQQGNLVDEKQISFSRRLEPATPFRQYWNFDYEPGTPQARLLLQRRGLVCKAEVQAVSLENGKLLYPHPYSELEEAPSPRAPKKKK